MDSVIVLVLIAYDTPSDRRRRHFDKTLCGYGERVQHSVFECWLSPEQYTHLKDKLAYVVNETEDHIRYYRMCRKDIAAIRTFGTPGPPRDATAIIV